MSSGSSRRSSSARQSRSERGGSETRRSGWPGWVRVATLPSGRTSSTGPDSRSRTTLIKPLPAGVRVRVTGQRRVSAIHPAMSSALGLSTPPVTVPAFTGSCGGWSNAAASSPRQSVTRLQARSVSPGT